MQGGEHPSAEQLFHRVSDAYPMMSRATVYKTLDTLNAAGEVFESSSEPHALAQRYHPERFTGDKQEATARMIEINEANEVLSDASSLFWRRVERHSAVL